MSENEFRSAVLSKLEQLMVTMTTLAQEQARLTTLIEQDTISPMPQGGGTPLPTGGDE